MLCRILHQLRFFVFELLVIFEGNNDETKFINITMILFSDRGGAGGYMSHDDSGVLRGGRGLGGLVGQLTMGVASKYLMPRPLGDLSMALLID